MSSESLTLPHLLAWRPAASPARCWRGQLLPATLCPVVPEQDRERASHPEEQAAHLQQPSASTSWGRGVPCGPLSSRRRGERPLQPSPAGSLPRAQARDRGGRASGPQAKGTCARPEAGSSWTRTLAACPAGRLPDASSRAGWAGSSFTWGCSALGRAPALCSL